MSYQSVSSSSTFDRWNWEEMHKFLIFLSLATLCQYVLAETTVEYLTDLPVWSENEGHHSSRDIRINSRKTTTTTTTTTTKKPDKNEKADTTAELAAELPALIAELRQLLANTRKAVESPAPTYRPVPYVPYVDPLPTRRVAYRSSPPLSLWAAPAVRQNGMAYLNTASYYRQLYGNPYYGATAEDLFPTEFLRKNLEMPTPAVAATTTTTTTPKPKTTVASTFGFPWLPLQFGSQQGLLSVPSGSGNRWQLILENPQTSKGNLELMKDIGRTDPKPRSGKALEVPEESDGEMKEMQVEMQEEKEVETVEATTNVSMEE